MLLTSFNAEDNVKTDIDGSVSLCNVAVANMTPDKDLIVFIKSVGADMNILASNSILNGLAEPIEYVSAHFSNEYMTNNTRVRIYIDSDNMCGHIDSVLQPTLFMYQPEFTALYKHMCDTYGLKFIGFDVDLYEELFGDSTPSIYNLLQVEDPNEEG